jgi:hypothetical protein
MSKNKQTLSELWAERERQKEEWRKNRHRTGVYCDTCQSELFFRNPPDVHGNWAVHADMESTVYVDCSNPSCDFSGLLPTR